MRRLYLPIVEGPGALGLLLLRLVTGAALMMHGFPKIQNAFAWMGPHAAVPGVFQALSAVAEFGGGLALIVGLLMPIACFLIACNMAVALFMVHWAKGDPWVAHGHGGSYESALGYFAIAVCLMLIGPGAISLDAILFPRSIRKNKADALQPEREKALL